MKLNYKRTILVGFAFFLIQVFWQAYDNTIPIILTNKFGMNQTLSGIIMALDNVLAIVLLPIFGSISDKHKGKKGRRTPFILIGSVVAIVAFLGLAVFDNAQLKSINEITPIDDPEVLVRIYEEESGKTLLTPEGESFVLNEKFTKEEFSAIKSTTTKDGKTITNPDYTLYVTPARRDLVHTMTSNNPSHLIAFIAMLGIALLAMSTFRSPAVALMPDVTIKPLRSKANAVINLMGSAGGITVLALGIVFATSSLKNSYMSYIPYFGVIALVMILALIIFMTKVKEPEFVADMEADSKRFGIKDEDSSKIDEENSSGIDEDSSKIEDKDSSEIEDEDSSEIVEEKKEGLSAGEKRSLIFMLLSIALWFMGYNAVTSKYSVYAGMILHKDYNLTLMIAQVAAIISYLPIGIISSKVGRKKTILAGVTMLLIAFGSAIFMRDSSPTMLMNLIFALAGVAWATINVNSFPMVVEMCARSDIGRYTGFYYTASMAAQVATPILSGALMDNMGMTVLFPYAAIFTALAFMTMTAVKHGDSKPESKKGLEALDAIADE